ncbi:MAG: DUF4386 domain-containing protein [Anaerolineae bacterium]|jgi:hypothetical protein
MNARNGTARSVGAFFLFSNVTFILGALVLVEPILSAPDYLTLVSENRTQVILGVLLEIANGVAYLGIAVLMFAVLRRRFESAALGYVGFRIIEFVMQALSSLGALSLVTLSEEFVGAGSADASAFQAAGTVLLAQRSWAFQMVSITLPLGALLFYPMLYRSKLIPRFISVWGVIGALTVLTTTMLDIFALSVGPVIGLILGLPMLLNELFLGVWLIIRGFNPSAMVSGSG